MGDEIKAEKYEKALLKRVMDQYKVDADKAAQMIADSRKQVKDNATTPEQFMKTMFKNPKLRVVGIGEQHDSRGRLQTNELMKAAIEEGASVLFVEVPVTDQPLLDAFIKSGDAKDLPYYMQALDNDTGILTMARDKKLALVAVDDKTKGVNRDQAMADNMIAYMKKNPKARGVLNVGMMHLAKFPNPDNNPNYPSVKERFEKEFPDSMVTLGRTVDNDSENSFLTLFKDTTGVVPLKGLPIGDVMEHDTVVPPRFNSYDYMLSPVRKPEKQIAPPMKDRDKPMNMDEALSTLKFPEYLVAYEAENTLPLSTASGKAARSGKPSKGAA